MQKNILTALSGLFLPLAGYAMPAASNTTYQRSYLAAARQTPTADLALHNYPAKHKTKPIANTTADELQLVQANPVRELIIIDSAVPDKALFYKAAKPGTDIIELTADADGLQQITKILQQYRSLAALHLVSHAEQGVLLLGNSRIDAAKLQTELSLFNALNGALTAGADVLLYGCDLAKGDIGAEFLDILQANTHADLAASNNLTGNTEKGGDWQLEIQRGQIDTELAFSQKALMDYSEVLAASDGTKTFAGWAGNNTSEISTTDFRMTARDGSNNVRNVGIFGGSIGYMATGTGNANHYLYVRADGTNTTAFELTGLSSGEAPGYMHNFTNIRIVGMVQGGGTVNSATISGTAAYDESFTFGGGQLGAFSGVKLTGFKLYFDCETSCDQLADVALFEFRSFTIQGATNTTPPAVTDGNISISGASGTGGAYKIGDTVTATWNNTAGGDNNSDPLSSVTVDFTQFGGGAAIAATNSAGTWSATYTIVSGAIDAPTRNVSVTATNSSGSTTTADTTNATVDNVALTVTDARISISGASGTGGAYKVGDTVTATWNNTAGGDNNSDTVSGVTVDFSQFGGGAAVAATNSSGTWTATYTITAGAIDATNRNVSVSATDNAGNITTTADTTNATVDSVAPTVTDANISISGGTGSGGTYIIGDTVTATWNNTTGGDNNSDSISNVTFDFSQFGGGAAVAATNSANTWTASYTVAAGAIEASGRNVSVTATDNAGNATTRADTSNAAVDNAAPTVANVSVPANATYITGQNLDFTVNIAGLSDVVVNTTGGTPRIALTIGAATRYASFVSGSASPFLTFRYTVQSGDVDANGIAVAGVIDANGGTLQDGSGNDMNLTLNAVGSTASVLVDAVAPTISSVSVPAADTYLVGETLSFTVNTTENVTVSTGGGTPHLPLTIGATAREAVYVSGSGTSALVFSYSVQAGDNDGDGIAIGGSAVLNGGTMRDAAGNDLTLSLNAIGDISGVLIDTAAPTLQTLSPADDSATVAANANFVMTFSEDITLGAGDITFYDSLNVQVAVIDVASHGGQLSITGNELTINPTADLSESTSYYIHVDNGAVTDLAGIAYAGIADSTTWNFTVADVTPPTVTAITVNGTPLANAETMQFTVSFDEVPANVTLADFSLTLSGATVSANIAGVSAVNANSVTVTIDQISGTGTLRLDVMASSGITDTLGNGNGTNGFVPAFTSGDLHTVDREAPGVPTGLSLDAASDSGTPGDAITNDNTPTINGTADANVTIEVSSNVDGVLGTTTSDGSGDWSFTPGAAMTDGAHNLTATAADTAGNESAASSALAIEVDTAAPTAGIDMADSTLVAGEASSVTITFSEAILGFTNDDLTLANGTLTNVSSSDGNVTWTATFTPAPDTTAATNLISLNMAAVTDVAGNAGSGSTNSANYSIDTLRPTASLVMADTELLAAETSQLTITFNEAVSGFTNDDLSVLFGSLDAVMSADGGITWTATYTPDPDTYELNNIITLDTSGVTDAAGNTGIGSTSSNEFTVRTQALTLLVTSDLDIDDDETTAVTLVDDEADGNGLSLREALFWARSNGDTITFDLDGGTAGNQGGTITLNGSELAVNHNNLIIDGDLDDDGMPDITLSGNNVSRIMRVASGRTGIQLVGLTLTQGADNGGGGGLALEINTDTTLRDSMITDNHELGWGGGGIYGSTATLRIINSTISGNSSDSFGGGIRLVGNGVLHLLNSTLSNNTTSGAGAHGAGIQYAGPDLLVVNTTISGNAAMGANAIGGGLRISGGTSTVYNSTIVGNVAGNSAGGVSANGTNDVFVNTVVAGNTAGAGATAGAGGSPLATGGSASDAIGTVEVATNSYFGTSATITTDNNSLNNQGTLDLLLGNLADNGGSVMTHRPMAGSALSDAGSNADLPADTYDLDSDTNVAEALPIDALGASRMSGVAVDIGAVEGNRAPVLLDLDGGNTHVEDGVAVGIDNDVTVTDDELDILNGGNGNYSGASVTIMRSGGVNSTDSFSFADGSGLSLIADEVLKNGQAIASFDTSSAGQLLLTFTDANGELPERSDVNAIMQQITYASTSNDPETSVQLDWTFTDEAGAPVTETASVSISLKNDAPVLTASGGAVTFTENGAAVDLFNNLSIDLIEAAQSVIGMQLTVTGVNNGSAEILTVDGSDVALTEANSLTTASNALQASVALTDSTATVSLSHATGISSALAEAILDAITYRNSSQDPSPLSRVVSLSALQDNGGTANDGVDSSTPAIATTVTISAVNNAPSISGSPTTVTNQNLLYSFTPAASDIDSAALTFSIVNQPAWASFNSATGTLSGVPAQADVGVNSNIVISVSDGELSSSLPAFSLTVIDVNDAPTISGSPVTTVAQDAPYSFTPTASDIDTGDNLTFSISNKPGWASFNTANGSLSGTPGNSDVGTTAGIVISVSDGNLNAALPAFSLTVTNVNDAPSISGTPATTVAQDAPYSFMPTASDIDTGTTLTFSISNKPGWASFNPSTGALTGTPGNSDVGTTAGIVISVSDGSLSAALPAFSLTVTNVNDAPSISGTPATTVAQDAAYSFTPTASDIDTGDNLTFSISNKPGWASFNTANGSLSGTPGNSDVGTTAGIVISVSDGSLNAVLPAFSLTVTNVNDAPSISGSPATTVAQDAPYSFMPTASDIDTGTTLSFSISNKPSWASFDTTTGALTGTPGNTDVGSTTGIVISVSDGSLSASLPAFSLSVSNVNDTPEITGTPLTSVDQDTAYSFIPTATDPDDDTLSFSISNKPSWASFDTATGALTGTPAKTDVGTTTGIVISVSDGEFTASLDAFNLEVVNVNAAPLAVDDKFTLPLSDNHSYLLDVLLNDTDPDGDSLTITAAKASIGLVSIQANKLLFTAPDNFSGMASFRYRISDGELSDMAQVTLQIAGSNQNAPVITAPSDLTVNATGLFTKVDVGVATAVDSTGNRLAVSLVNGLPLFTTGRHELYWRATDASGQSSTVTQLLQVNPLVSLSKPQTVLNNSTVSVDVILNGPAPAYPVEVGYVVTGSASALTEHDLATGSVQIDSGLHARISFNVFADLTTEAEKQIVITLDDSLNLGANASTTITVTEANLAPVVQLDAQQQGENRLTLSKTAGVVTVSALVSDANPADTVELQWQADAALLNSSADTSQFVFDPADLSSGVYRIAVTATDDAAQPLSRTAEVYLLVQDSLPVLDDSDSNNNLIPDNVEGLGDSNGNGIADYLDPGFDCNVIPEQLAAVTQFVAEGEPGICLRKGATAALSNSGGIQLTSTDLQWLEPDMQASNIGGTFDFILRNLPATGASYALVLPQRQPVPANAVYRKFTPANGWNNFVQNEQNRLFSAPGEPGFCPPPGSSSWQSGLTAGHWCVQLQIEDGGPNDADGLANGAIVDPGGVAVILNNNQLPVAADDSYAVQWNQSHTLDVLQNDTDADADTLSINQATAAFGSVSISDDGLTLLYTPAQDFVGEDSLSYAITDGNNGSASATVTVTVYYNRAPVVTDATASTDDRTSLELDVLANASDPDGDTLVISSAAAQHGSVSVTAAQTLSYMPQPGFDGTDTVSFTLSDQRGGSVNGTVSITVTAYEVITVVNKSSGGALYGWPLLLLAAMAVIRRRQSVLKPLFILAALFSCNSQANWSVEALFGNSTTRQSTAEVSSLLPADAELLQYDNSGNSWALGLSYYFTPRLALQAHYVDLGDASVSIRGDSLTPAQFHQAVSDIGPMLAEGVRSGLSYDVWQYAGWSATVQAGVFAWDSETNSTAGDNLIQNKASDTDIYWALGARYALDQHIALQAMFNRYHLEGNKADNIMLGVSYHF